MHNFQKIFIIFEIYVYYIENFSFIVIIIKIKLISMTLQILLFSYRLNLRGIKADELAIIIILTTVNYYCFTPEIFMVLKFKILLYFQKQKF